MEDMELIETFKCQRSIIGREHMVATLLLDLIRDLVNLVQDRDRRTASLLQIKKDLVDERIKQELKQQFCRQSPISCFSKDLTEETRKRLEA